MVIGLTGGVGTGKSTVAAMLRELGATVLDADEASRAVVEPGTPGFEQIVEAFGRGIVRDGRLDRQALADLIFADAKARERLNAITHPLVREWMAEGQQAAIERGDRWIVQDIPLLYENGLDALFPEVILVWAPPELQVRRLVEGRGLAVSDARARIAAQLPIGEKRARARHVIDNSGSLEETRRQVEATWRELTAEGPPAR